MHLLPTAEQETIIDGAARFVEARLPFDRLFRYAGGRQGDFEALWDECAKAGWFAMGLGEAHGGVGFSVVEEMLIQRELGRNLAPLCLLATPLAARVAAEAGEDDLARDLAEGRRRAGFAVRMADDLLFLDGDVSDLALTIKAGRVDVREVQPRARREEAGCIDPGVPAVRIGSVCRGVETVASSYDDAVLARARILIAAHMTAAAERARDLAVDYAKVRQQFGRPIGAFQAIKHRCTDMAIRCEAAFTQGCVAAAALRDGAEDAILHVASGYVVAREAAVENGRHAAQVHGAIGMTDEHVIHLLIKRAHVLESLGAERGLLEVLLAA